MIPAAIVIAAVAGFRCSADAQRRHREASGGKYRLEPHFWSPLTRFTGEERIIHPSVRFAERSLQRRYSFDSERARQSVDILDFHAFAAHPLGQCCGHIPIEIAIKDVCGRGRCDTGAQIFHHLIGL